VCVCKVYARHLRIAQNFCSMSGRNQAEDGKLNNEAEDGKMVEKTFSSPHWWSLEKVKSLGILFKLTKSVSFLSTSSFECRCA
jgi:hypothetical protein